MCPQMAEAFYVSFLILAVEIPFYEQHRARRGNKRMLVWAFLQKLSSLFRYTLDKKKKKKHPKSNNKTKKS